MKTEKELISPYEKQDEYISKWNDNAKCLTQNMVSYVKKKNIFLYALFGCLVIALIVLYFFQFDVEFKDVMLISAGLITALVLFAVYVEMKTNRKFVISTIADYNSGLIMLYNSVLRLKEKQDLQDNYEKALKIYGTFYLKFHNILSEGFKNSLQTIYGEIVNLKTAVNNKDYIKTENTINKIIDDGFVLNNYMKIKERVISGK